MLSTRKAARHVGKHRGACVPCCSENIDVDVRGGTASGGDAPFFHKWVRSEDSEQHFLGETPPRLCALCSLTRQDKMEEEISPRFGKGPSLPGSGGLGVAIAFCIFSCY